MRIKTNDAPAPHAFRMHSSSNKIALLRGRVVGMTAYVVHVPQDNWRACLQHTQTLDPWLEDEDDAEWCERVLCWLTTASEGDVMYRHEGLALDVKDRAGDDILLRDYEGPSYVVVRLCRALPGVLNFHSMD